MVNAYRKALQSLWTGVCTVYVRVPSPTPDPATGRTVWAVEAVAEAVPCRLSFETLSETQDESSAAKVTQSVKLFLDPAVPLPAGSKLTVTQNGVPTSSCLRYLLPMAPDSSQKQFHSFRRSLYISRAFA